MERKGLSQILYLIIAASVLMMIAMVITFTATDTIGGLGGSASETSCLDALTGKCTASVTNRVSVPASTCVTEGQYVGGITSSMVNTAPDGSGSTVSAADLEAGTTGYISCSASPIS